MTAADDKGWIERLLTPVADVRRGEVASVLLMAATLLLLLGSYYMLKTAREVLILTRGGAEVKAYAAAAQAILLLGLVPAFSALASRLSRVRLLLYVTLFFVADLLLFAMFGRTSQFVGIVFFLWIGIFSVMIVAQFWAFAADLYDPEQGQRLFPVIGLGSSLGAWIGSVQAGRVLRALGPFALMIVGAAILIVCVLLVAVVHRYEVRRLPHRAREATAPCGPDRPFAMIFGDRYLLLIAVLVVTLNIVNTSGEYIFGRLVLVDAATRFGTGPETAGQREAFVGGVYSTYFAYVNLAGFLIQLVLVSRIFKWVGVARSLYIQPLVALAAYAMMLRPPPIAFVASFKVADNSLDYSLGNTAREALWLPTGRAAKYKAKQAIDSFFTRLGDVLQAGVVYAGQALSFQVSAFAAVNVGLTLVWLGLVHRLKPIYDARTAAAREHVAASGVNAWRTDTGSSSNHSSSGRAEDFG